MRYHDTQYDRNIFRKYIIIWNNKHTNNASSGDPQTFSTYLFSVVFETIMLDNRVIVQLRIYIRDDSRSCLLQMDDGLIKQKRER